jgi:hypothetical protein
MGRRRQSIAFFLSVEMLFDQVSDPFFEGINTYGVEDIGNEGDTEQEESLVMRDAPTSHVKKGVMVKLSGAHAM